MTIAVLAGDSDPDEDPLMVSAANQAGHGVVSTDGHTVVYRPDLNFNGADSFTYTISDGNLTAEASVAVSVTAVNDPPTAVDDLVVTEKNTAATFNVLPNDTDVDGDAVNVSAVGSAAHGAVTLQPNVPLPVPERKITYTPAQDFTGADVFTYTLTDGALTATGSVTVRVVTFDVDGDGDVDVGDVQLVAANWRTSPPDPRYDLDGEGGIDIVDIMLIVKVWLGAYP